MNHLPFLTFCMTQLEITISDIRTLPNGEKGIIVYFERPNKSGLIYDNMECYITENRTPVKMINITGFSSEEISRQEKAVTDLADIIWETAEEYMQMEKEKKQLCRK